MNVKQLKDFLFANEVVSVKELNKKQLKRFKKLKPLVYSSKGIIKPIYSKLIKVIELTMMLLLILMVKSLGLCYQKF